METVTRYHALIDQMMLWSGMSDKFMHVNAGMAIFVAVQVALRTRRASITALLVVVLLEATNEVLDRLFSGSWRLRDTTGDIFATLFWPTVIVLMSKYRRARWQVDVNREKETRRSILRSIVRPHLGLARSAPAAR